MVQAQVPRGDLGCGRNGLRTGEGGSGMPGWGDPSVCLHAESSRGQGQETREQGS